jgi:hypothetical protein
MIDKNKQLQSLKERREAVLIEKAELTARLKSAQEQYKQLSQEIMDNYNIDPGDLPKLIQEKEAAYDAKLQALSSVLTQAEQILSQIKSK